MQEDSPGKHKKRVYNWKRSLEGMILLSCFTGGGGGGEGVFLGIIGGGVPPGFPNPDSISDHKMSIFNPFSDLGPVSRKSR